MNALETWSLTFEFLAWGLIIIGVITGAVILSNFLKADIYDDDEHEDINRLDR